MAEAGGDIMNRDFSLAKQDKADNDKADGGPNQNSSVEAMAERVSELRHRLFGNTL